MASPSVILNSLSYEEKKSLLGIVAVSVPTLDVKYASPERESKGSVLSKSIRFPFPTPIVRIPGYVMRAPAGLKFTLAPPMLLVARDDELELTGSPSHTTCNPNTFTCFLLYEYLACLA